MSNVAYFSLLFWFPVVFFVFERLPVGKAIVFSFVSAWLFLPPTVIDLSGVPDWGKMSATVTSVLICTALKRSDVYLRLKPSWLDLPVLAYCLCPFASAISSNQGAYDGLSAVLEESFRWGFPYLIGRAFLGDAAGNRLLCYGIALGGIVYIPICLIELRMGPILKMLVYGINDNSTVFDLRYGGYRPMGFLQTGLELGWWMCCATFSAYLLWRSGAVRRFMGYPMGAITVLLGLITVSCKSTGAILQLAIGFAAIHLVRATKRSIILWSILLIPPAYCIARPTGIWTGDRLVSYAAEYFGPDRAQSLGFRFGQEEGLMRFAMQRPALGWGRNGGFNPPDKNGRSLTTDGLWIIIFGTMGGVGLAALVSMLLIPSFVFSWRFGADRWFEPDVAPVTALVVLLPLFMIDNLSNAMLNPIYAMAMGSVSGYLATGRSRGPGSGVLPDSGYPAAMGAMLAPGQAVDHRAANAEAAWGAYEARHYEESIRLLDDELDDLHSAFRRRPSADRLVEMGRAHALRARCYQRMGEVERSIEEREYLVGLSSQFAVLLGGDPAASPEFADNLNDLAWALLAARPDDRASVDRAADHATRVVEAHPAIGAYWNTLGVARYRAGDHLGAVQALSRSVKLSPDQGSPYDFFYLALANHRLGYRKPAEAWLGRAEAMLDGRRVDPELEKLMDEALSVMQA